MHLSIIDNRNSSGKFSHIVSKHFVTSNLEHGPGGSGGLSNNGSFGFLSRSKLDRLVERPASTLALAALACLAFNRRRCLSACKASECVHFTRQNRFKPLQRTPVGGRKGAPGSEEKDCLATTTAGSHCKAACASLHAGPAARSRAAAAHHRTFGHRAVGEAGNSGNRPT
jgi:hypothetical protein